VIFSRIGGRCCAPEVAGRINSIPRAKRRITWELAQNCHERPSSGEWEARGYPEAAKRSLIENRYALQRADRHPRGKAGIGRLSDEAGLVRRPKRIGVQPLAEALVSVNRDVDQFLSGDLFLSRGLRDLDQRTLRDQMLPDILELA
jgi:hypothetical protein